MSYLKSPISDVKTSPKCMTQNEILTVWAQSNVDGHNNHCATSRLLIIPLNIPPASTLVGLSHPVNG